MSAVPEWLRREANAAHECRGRVKPSAETVLVMCDGQPAGFYTPHMAANGRMRIGPFYIRPEYRRRGLALAIYAGYNKPMMACIEDDNHASVALHERAGFVRWRRYAHGWYWRRG